MKSITIKIFLFFCILLFFRNSTIFSDWIGLNHANSIELSNFDLDWFPSFTWLVLDKKYILFSLGFWFIINIFFEIGQSLPKEYTQYFPKLIEDYCNNETYSHGDVLTIVVATLVAYFVIKNLSKRSLK